MERKGDWIQTYTGKRFYPLDPRPEEIDPIDIARALANQARFSGHTIRHYSVIEHSLRVAYLVPRSEFAYALLHDAAEAYLVDIPRPMKRLPEFQFYRQAEAALMTAIEKRFALEPGQPNEVSSADKAMLWHEYRALMMNYLPEWDKWMRFGAMYPDGKFIYSIPTHEKSLEQRWLAGLRGSVGELVFAGHHLNRGPECQS